MHQRQYEALPPRPLGLLYTLGYAARNAYERIACLVDLDITIGDIRFHPTSSHPWWQQAHLQQWLGGYYWHLPALGNIRYQHRDQAIELAQPEVGLPLVIEHLWRGESLALLCACAEPEGCHRLLVANLVQVHLPTLIVIHL